MTQAGHAPSLLLRVCPPPSEGFNQLISPVPPGSEDTLKSPSPSTLSLLLSPSVSPDTDLIRSMNALIQVGEDLTLPCPTGLRAVLSKFSGNREKAQRLLLSPVGRSL